MAKEVTLSVDVKIPAENGKEITVTAKMNVRTLPVSSWNEKRSKNYSLGKKKAEELLKQGLRFKAEILSPREVPDEGSTKLAVALFELDKYVAIKQEMVESVRDILTKLEMMDKLNPAYPVVLQAIIEGKNLYEHNIGEFYLLYGKFEQMFGTQGTKTKKKMNELVDGKEEYLKSYTTRGKKENHPLPYAVRNILSHIGHNPNNLGINDLKNAINLLRLWINP